MKVYLLAESAVYKVHKLKDVLSPISLLGEQYKWQMAKENQICELGIMIGKIA